MVSLWEQVNQFTTIHFPLCVFPQRDRTANSLRFPWLRLLGIAQILKMSGLLTLGTRPARLGWSVVSRSTSIRWTSKQELFHQTECLVHVSRPPPCLTRQHRRTHKHSTDDHEEQIQTGSFHHVTWICMLTAVHNFLSLTPTPPHPHIHLSNMTPLPTRRRPGCQCSLRKPDYIVPPSSFRSYALVLLLL